MSKKRAVKAIPLIGPGIIALRRWWLKKDQTFEREELPKADFLLPQARNLLSYTKFRTPAYSGQKFPAGYHTIQLCGQTIAGQRNPEKRLAMVPFDFAGKSVLDIGSNQGGMLHAMNGCLAWGVGVDYDPRLVNAATKVARIRNDRTLSFYNFDLENDPLHLIEDLIPEKRADVVFFLAMCNWVRNWPDVMQYLSTVSDHMLFEANGPKELQQEQEALLRSLYWSVICYPQLQRMTRVRNGDSFSGLLTSRDTASARCA